MAKHQYIITIEMAIDEETFGAKVSLDSFYKLEVNSGMSQETINVAKKISPDFGKNDNHVYNMMLYRHKFNPHQIRGPFLINTDVKIDRKTLDDYIRSLSPASLRTFMKEAKV